ncbi:MAG: hypothetical protein PVJ98_04090 [Akkermansiaceae bacterium]|jgi:hypothetical protein
MSSEIDPYAAPDNGPNNETKPERFSSWSTPSLVALFFLPGALFALAFCLGLLVDRPLYAKICVFAALGLAVVVSILSATIHTVRGKAGFGTLALFTFVYLLAQVLSLLTARFAIWVFSGL